MTVGESTEAAEPRAGLLPSRAAVRPLRIVIGLEGLALGGCPINALDLGRTLRHRGHEVSVFAIDEHVKVSLLPYALAAGFEVDLLPIRTNVMPLSREIAQRAKGADVIHVFAPWLAPAARVAAAMSPGLAVVSTNWTMSNVSYVPQDVPQILGTAKLQRDAQSTHRSPVWLIEPPVDLAKDAPDVELGRAFRRQWGIADVELAAVIVSRVDTIMKSESMRYAIRALRILEDPAWRLVIVGDGDAFDDIAAEARRTNEALARPAVVLTGALRDPRPAYSAADVALGMGGSALRSLAHGKPLVVLGINGFARTFKPDTCAAFYESGFFGQAGDGSPENQLASELAPLLDPETRRRLGDFGRGEVDRRFSLETAAATLESVYTHATLNQPSVARQALGASYVLARSLAHEARSAIAGRGHPRIADADSIGTEITR